MHSSTYGYASNRSELLQNPILNTGTVWAMAFVFKESLCYTFGKWIGTFFNNWNLMHAFTRHLNKAICITITTSFLGYQMYLFKNSRTIKPTIKNIFQPLGCWKLVLSLQCGHFLYNSQMHSILRKVNFICRSSFWKLF